MCEWDWNKKIPNWDHTSAALHGYIAWDKFGDKPPFVLFEIVDGEHMSSRDMAVAWDDVVVNRWHANGAFDYRDWTASSMPWVNEKEKYWSGFTFQYEVDARAFQEMFGGIGNWDVMYETARCKMVYERDGARISAYPSRKAERAEDD